jgi:hypothetical protein
VAVAALIATLLVGCTDYPHASNGKYAQTWPKRYTRTTCAEWHQDMSFDQQFIATAEIFEAVLGGDRMRVRLPPDEVLDGYRKAIDAACADPTATLYTVAIDAIKGRMEPFVLGAGG